MRALVRQFMRFAAVGIIAFAIDYGFMVVFTELFGINYLISATVSFTMSVIFSYFASMRYVFAHRESLTRRREFIIFVILSFIGLGLNDILMFIGTSLLGITYFITKIVATVIVTWWNFISRRRFLDAGVREDIDIEIEVEGAEDAESAEGVDVADVVEGVNVAEDAESVGGEMEDCIFDPEESNSVTDNDAFGLEEDNNIADREEEIDTEDFE